MGIGGFASSGFSALNQGVSVLRQSSFEMYEIAKEKVKQVPVEQLTANGKKAFVIAKDMVRGHGEEVKVSFSARDVRHIPIANVVATLLETRSIHKQSQELSDELRIVYGTGERVNANIAKLVGKAFLFYWFCLGKKRWFTRFIITDLLTTACSWALSSPKTVGSKSDDALGGLYIPKHERFKIIDPRWTWALKPEGRKLQISRREAVFALHLSQKQSVDVPKTVDWDAKVGVPKTVDWNAKLEGDLTYSHLVGADSKLLRELHSKDLGDAREQSAVELATKKLFGAGNSRLSLEELNSMLTSAGLKEDWDRTIKELGKKTIEEKKAAQDAAVGPDSEEKHEELLAPSHIKDLMTLLGYPENDTAEGIIDTVERFSTLAETVTVKAKVLPEKTVKDLVAHKQQLYDVLRQIPSWLLDLGLNTAGKMMHDLQQLAGDGAEAVKRAPLSLKETKKMLLMAIDVMDARIAADGTFILQDFERGLIDSRKAELLKLVEPAKYLLQEAEPKKLTKRAIQVTTRSAVLALSGLGRGVGAITDVAQKAITDVTQNGLGPVSQQRFASVPKYFEELAAQLEKITNKERQDTTDHVEFIDPNGTTTVVKDEPRHKLGAEIEHTLAVARDLNAAVLVGDTKSKVDLLTSLSKGVFRATVDGIRSAAEAANGAKQAIQERLPKGEAGNKVEQALSFTLEKAKAVQERLQAEIRALKQPRIEDVSEELTVPGVVGAPGAQFEEIIETFMKQSIEAIGSLINRQMQNLQPQGGELVIRQQERAHEDVESFIRKQAARIGRGVEQLLRNAIGEEIHSNDETLAVQNAGVVKGAGAQFEALVKAFEQQAVDFVEKGLIHFPVILEHVLFEIERTIAGSDETSEPTIKDRSGSDEKDAEPNESLELVEQDLDATGSTPAEKKLAARLVKQNLAAIGSIVAEKIRTVLRSSEDKAIENASQSSGFGDFLERLIRQNVADIRDAVAERMGRDALEDQTAASKAITTHNSIDVEDVTDEYLTKNQPGLEMILTDELRRFLPKEQQNSVMVSTQRIEQFAQEAGQNVQELIQRAKENPESILGEILKLVPSKAKEGAVQAVAHLQSQATLAILGAQRVVGSISNETFALIDRARQGDLEAIGPLISQVAKVFGLEAGARKTLEALIREILAIEAGDDKVIEKGAPMLTALVTKQVKAFDSEGKIQEAIEILDGYRKLGLEHTGNAEAIINALDGDSVQNLVNAKLTGAHKKDLRELKGVLAKAKEKVDNVSDEYLDAMTAAARAFIPSKRRHTGKRSTAPVDFNPKDFKSTRVSIDRVQAQLIAEYKKSSDGRLLDLIGMLQKSFAKIRIGEELCVKVEESDYVAAFPDDWNYSQRKVYTDLFNKVSGLPKAKMQLKEPLGRFFARVVYEDARKKKEAEKKRRKEHLRTNVWDTN
jgi:hypothetical protein